MVLSIASIESNAKKTFSLILATRLLDDEMHLVVIKNGERNIAHALKAIIMNIQSSDRDLIEYQNHSLRVKKGGGGATQVN